MCWQCKEIDQVIEHYRALIVRTTDKLTHKNISLLIVKLESDKKNLHPED
jgi:hypothetical protein